MQTIFLSCLNYLNTVKAHTVYSGTFTNDVVGILIPDTEGN